MKIPHLLLNWFFPPRCPICESIVPQIGEACQQCINSLSYIDEPACMKCGKSVEDAETEYCPDCQRKRFSYISGKAVWTYNQAVAASIARFKYKDKREYAHFYGNQMTSRYGAWIQSKQIHAIVPIPIHPARRAERGYNQTELLTRVISENLSCPVIDRGLYRIKRTARQKELNDVQRKENLVNAFRADQTVFEGVGRILLVDDIYTTGSTIEACTRVILESGVKEVYFLCISIGISR